MRQLHIDFGFNGSNDVVAAQIPDLLDGGMDHLTWGSGSGLLRA